MVWYGTEQEGGHTSSVESGNGNIVAHSPVNLLYALLDSLRRRLLLDGRRREGSLRVSRGQARRRDGNSARKAGGLGEERHDGWYFELIKIRSIEW